MATLVSLLLALSVGNALACPANIEQAPSRHMMERAIGVIKGELVDIRSGPRGDDGCGSLVLRFTTEETLKGPRYPYWDVFWDCGRVDRYREGGTYLAAIYRISTRYRGDPKYDFFGEVWPTSCANPATATIYEWSAALDNEMAEWVKP